VDDVHGDGIEPMSSPIATVAAVLVKDGKVLLVRRGHVPFRGFWALPGGHIDSYEPARKAIVREVKEETGMELKPRFFGYYNEIIMHKDWHAVVLAFDGDFVGKEVGSSDSEEVKEVKWFRVEELRDLKIGFYHRDIINDYLRKLGERDGKRDGKKNK